jgi:hypothetical protein
MFASSNIIVLRTIFNKMKKKTIKSLKRISRERIPLSSLREKVIDSKKRKLLAKALKKETLEETASND